MTAHHKGCRAHRGPVSEITLCGHRSCEGCEEGRHLDTLKLQRLKQWLACGVAFRSPTAVETFLLCAKGRQQPRLAFISARTVSLWFAHLSHSGARLNSYIVRLGFSSLNRRRPTPN